MFNFIKITRYLRWINRILYVLIVFFVLIIAFFFAADYYIMKNAGDRITNDINDIKEKRVVLVFGTSYKIGNRTNLYFTNRMVAAYTLYKSGKASHFILSGDNSFENYDEASDMKKYLVEMGIPENMITLDYAGFRTLDSVVRLKKVFGQDKVILISQDFHLKRALFFCDQYDIDAIGFAAKDVKGRALFWISKREWLARGLAVLDVFVFNTQPKFLGPAIDINQE